MTHEKIFKRADGTRVKVAACLLRHGFGRQSQFAWRIECFTSQKDRGKFKSVLDCYSWMSMDYADRAKELRRLNLAVATKEEIEQTMRELVGKIPMEY